ncbi:MAG: DNA adenine methylase, partial [Spirochaeta sp.]
MRYLQDQLIAYIGNKRTLLPFLQRVFSQYAGAAAGLRFYDPFAGAGAVSRLAKTMGYQVHCNDWEEYSYVINSCWLGVDQCDLDLIFQKRGGVEAVFNELQSVGEHGKPVQPYISRHYAPKRTATADYRRERLFYTRENAEFIDAVRTQIDEWYPDGELEAGDIRAKHILLGSLLYEAATHANTSGVFKAFHKGFGGHGGDALGRIMAPMQLEIPVLHDSLPGVRHVVTRMDAARAAGEGSYDLVYLDPPYNCHQYGSNYFMLNTIARWDRPAVDNSFAPDGRLAQKAGIRKDWTDTRSPFCSRSLASQALAGLLDTLDSRFIMMSYNTDGIISFEEQMDLFASRGKV